MKPYFLTLAALTSLTTSQPTSQPTQPLGPHISPPRTLPVQPQPTISIRILDSLPAAPSSPSLPTHMSPLADDSSHLRPRVADTRGATIFKRENLAGQSTFLPAINYCTDMSNIFGGFDGEVRSLTVEMGVKCDFYQ